jgi:hypothetical protein
MVIVAAGPERDKAKIGCFTGQGEGAGGSVIGTCGPQLHGNHGNSGPAFEPATRNSARGG